MHLKLSDPGSQLCSEVPSGQTEFDHRIHLNGIQMFFYHHLQSVMAKNSPIFSMAGSC